VESFVVVHLIGTKDDYVIADIFHAWNSVKYSLDGVLESFCCRVYTKVEALVLEYSYVRGETRYVATGGVQDQLVVARSKIDRAEDGCSVEGG
jgi:hypothetical protein